MIRVLLYCLSFWFFIGVAYAADLPRMGSISADEVNIRSGPGLDYPIQWVYQQKRLPIKIVAEYKNWLKFIDWEGQEGWVFKRLASDVRSFIITAEEVLLYFDADNDSQVVARIAKDKVGEVTHCGDSFCRVKILDSEGNIYFGWVEEQYIWGGCTGEDKEGACAS